MAKSCAECGLPIDLGGEFYTVRHGSNFKMGEERIFCSRDCLVKSLTADNAKSRPEAIVNAIKPFAVYGDTEVKSAYDLIALVQRAIADIQVETRGNFNPRKHAFTISVIASFAHLLNEPLCGMCTARDWLIREYGLCTIGIIADTPEYIVKVNVFMNDFLREFEARRKTFDTDTNGKCNAEKVNADGTEVTTPKHMIILIENCIKDIVSMTHGEFNPKERYFNIAVTMSYVRLLDKPIGEGEEAKVTANVYQTMKWKYPLAEIVGVADRDHYIVRVDAVVNGKPYSSYRKTLGECAVRA